MRKPYRVGIIGYGSFGKFLAKSLSPYADLLIYNRSKEKLRNLPPTYKAGKLSEVASQPIVILAINIAAYPDVLDGLAPYISNETLIVDVASVKVESLRLIRKYLPAHKNILATHPLFGPESAAKSVKGLTIVLCNKIKQQQKLEYFLSKTLGLKLVHMSATDHDKQMTIVQALTFFIAQGLINMGLSKPVLSTPSFEKLLKLAELEKHHSKELFETIQKYNPYSSNVRKKLIKELTSLDQKL